MKSHETSQEHPIQPHDHNYKLLHNQAFSTEVYLQMWYMEPWCRSFSNAYWLPALPRSSCSASLAGPKLWRKDPAAHFAGEDHSSQQGDVRKIRRDSESLTSRCWWKTLFQVLADLKLWQVSLKTLHLHQIMHAHWKHLQMKPASSTPHIANWTKSFLVQILPFLIFVTFQIFSTVLAVLAQAQWEELSSNAKGFVKSLLTLDQTKRLSSADALRHPWLHQSLSLCPMLGRLQAKIAD